MKSLQKVEKAFSGMIGLEIHTYLVTREKLFCQCVASREKGLQPNIHICPICTGQPGAKPMRPNKTAVSQAVGIGLMLGCTINDFLPWQRKHYSWPDLPKGYQNTLSGTGATPVGVSGKYHGISISEMHLEEDPASWNPDTGEIDYNRSGLPLVEIVTAPDFSTGEEVIDWLKKLLHGLAYLKAVDSDAGIKVDVNVSVNGGKRVEVKNINSLEGVEGAIRYEFERQLKERVVMETRRYDEVQKRTMSMREKEGAADYRFIRDPDLVSLSLKQGFILDLKKRLPEDPEKKLATFMRLYKMDSASAALLTKHIDVAVFFEKVAEKIDPQFALSWVTVELFRLLNEREASFAKVDISVEHFVLLLEMVKQGKITVLQGKALLKQFYPRSFDPSVSVKGKITDEKELGKVIASVLSEEKKAVSDFRAGDVNALNFLLGAVMKKTEKRADYAITRRLLEGLLGK
ncbi:MAG TPA: Asp-tRNA(Asn)/Glu-tRNA(Gln) amidotransferase subunit GatB [Candidatus Nanoarchaeia archaeon]|nr:Asp-tRNA(Asn)/Glu-tRNA(Gln) amidotransferase subunit GatB [Candidatus Nanoarchaeia archaeon]